MIKFMKSLFFQTSEPNRSDLLQEYALNIFNNMDKLYQTLIYKENIKGSQKIQGLKIEEYYKIYLKADVNNILPQLSVEEINYLLSMFFKNSLYIDYNQNVLLKALTERSLSKKGKFQSVDLPVALRERLRGFVLFSNNLPLISFFIFLVENIKGNSKSESFFGSLALLHFCTSDNYSVIREKIFFKEDSLYFFLNSLISKFSVSTDLLNKNIPTLLLRNKVDFENVSILPCLIHVLESNNIFMDFDRDHPLYESKYYKRQNFLKGCEV